MNEAKGHTVLVIGGSGGIGRAVVEVLLRERASVAFTYRRGEQRARELETATEGHSTAFQLDLADRGGPERVVREVEERLGPIDGLVNTAGVERGQLLALTPDSHWDEVIDINLGGTFRCCRAVLRGMVTRRRGAIVNLSSLAATRGVAGLSAYAAAKAGILAMTRCLAREVGGRGIRVNAVVPGFVPTDMTAGLREDAVEKLRVGEALASGTDVWAVAEAVAFLLSERAAAITGQALSVDAGSSA